MSGTSEAISFAGVRYHLWTQHREAMDARYGSAETPLTWEMFCEYPSADLIALHAEVSK